MSPTPIDAVVISPAVSPAPAAQLLREYDADDLLAGADGLILRFRAQIYRLRVTQNGKLILTK